MKKNVLNRTIKNSVSLIDKEKDECWKLQKFKWTRFQIVIVFCFDNWQATDFLKEIITNIYNSFCPCWNFHELSKLFYVLLQICNSSLDLHLMTWQRSFNCEISWFILFEQQSFETFFKFWLSRKKDHISSKTSSQSRATLHSRLYQSKRNTFFFSKRERR